MYSSPRCPGPTSKPTRWPTRSCTGALPNFSRFPLSGSGYPLEICGGPLLGGTLGLSAGPFTVVRAFAFALERVVRIVPCSLYACLIGLSSGSFYPLMLRSAASAVLALYAESYLTALSSVVAEERVRRPPFAARVATPALCW